MLYLTFVIRYQVIKSLHENIEVWSFPFPMEHDFSSICFGAANGLFFMNSFIDCFLLHIFHMYCFGSRFCRIVLYK